MPGDASDSSEDSDTQTNEKACTVKHQITNGKSNMLSPDCVRKYLLEFVVFRISDFLKLLLILISNMAYININIKDSD